MVCTSFRFQMLLLKEKDWKKFKNISIASTFFLFFLFLKKGSKQKLLSGGEKGGGCIFPAFFLSERYRRNLKKSLILDFKPNNLSAALSILLLPLHSGIRTRNFVYLARWRGQLMSA